LTVAAAPRPFVPSGLEPKMISSPTAYPVPPLLILIRPTEPFVLILNVLLPAVYVAPKASK